MPPRLISPEKIQQGARQIALRLSDSTFITARKVRQAAQKAFGSNEAKQRREFLGQLESLLKSDSPTVRLAVVEALERVSREQAQTAGAIQSILQTAVTDNDAGVRQAAEAALERNI